MTSNREGCRAAARRAQAGLGKLMSGFSYVYTLQSESDPNRFYVGLTDDLAARLAKHNAGGVPHTLTLAKRNAAMQHYGMTITLPLSKRGSLTLPPAIRQKMGLDKLPNPMVLVEEREGGLFLQPAVALPVRDLPKKQIEKWIARDEAEMAAFRASPRKTKP